MSASEIAAAALREVRRLTGIPCIWKTITCWQHQDPAFTEDLFHHCNPFCLAVKGNRACLEKCKTAELEELLARVSHERQAFYRVCHAGVVELIVPVIYLGQIEGCLIFGPFRTPGVAGGLEPHAESLREQLPLLNTGQLSGSKALLETVAAGLAGLSSLPTLKPTSDARIAKSIAYIHRHLEDPLTAGLVARHCGMSISRFTHLFTKETGMSFAQYVIELRVEQAKRFLADPGRGKAEIATALGFSDQSHFCNTFKRVTGQTPGAFQAWARAQTERHSVESNSTAGA